MTDELSPEIQERFDLLQKKYEHGQSLVAQRNFEEALAAFKECVEFGVTKLPLMINDYYEIMLSMAFCHADMSNVDEALKIYHHLEDALNQEGNWYKAIPADGIVAIPASFDSSIYLANLYDSIAIAYDNTNQLESAALYYQNALKLYNKLGEDQRATKTWYCIGNGCKRRQDWAGLQQVGERMLQHCEKSNAIDGQIEALHFLIQAHVNMKHLDETLLYLRRVVALEKPINHPMLAFDEKMLQDMSRDTEKLKPAKKGWPFWKKN